MATVQLLGASSNQGRFSHGAEAHADSRPRWMVRLHKILHTRWRERAFHFAKAQNNRLESGNLLNPFGFEESYLLLGFGMAMGGGFAKPLECF